MFTVKIDVSDAATMLKNHGLNPGGRVQAFFTSEIMRKADPYVPFSVGVLKNSARVSEDKCAIIYGGAGERYAHYQWEGKANLYHCLISLMSAAESLSRYANL